jgi:hypothetical protein
MQSRTLNAQPAGSFVDERLDIREANRPAT